MVCPNICNAESFVARNHVSSNIAAAARKERSLRRKDSDMNIRRQRSITVSVMILFLLLAAFPAPTVQAVTDCAVQAQIPPAECEALVALYNSTGGPGWDVSTNWLETNVPCGWYGVWCTSDYTHVRDIQITGNSLVGSIPPEIDNLTNLRWLRLGGNDLTGVPPEIGNLSNLEELALWANDLTSVPWQIGNLSNLTHLDLSDNQLTTIPPEIGNLSNLTELLVQGNQLTSIPSEIGNLTNLTELWLAFNNLTSIPASIGNLTNIDFLWLQMNDLTSIPSEIGNLTKLTELPLFDNDLTSLPATIGNLTNLESLILSRNQLSSLPATIGNLSNLTELNLIGNRLSSLPSSFTNLTALTSLDVSYNMLGGLAPGLAAFLNSKDPGWELSQTVPPENVQVDEVVAGDIKLTWSPILFTGWDGYYEIGYSTTSGGPYTVHGHTVDKSAGQYLVVGLAPGTYYLAVRTFTAANSINPNDLLTDWSAEAMVVTALSLTVDQPSVTVDEGQVATNSGTVTGASNLSASVGTINDNGDGTWSWSFPTADGPDESQTVTITADDGYSNVVTKGFGLTVNNVAPVVDAGADATIGMAETFSLNATFTDPGTLDTHTAVIDWGDGTVEPGAVSAGTVTGTHDYSGPPQTYTVIVSVTDKDGGVGSDSLMLTREGGPPSEPPGHSDSPGNSGNTPDPPNRPVDPPGHSDPPGNSGNTPDPPNRPVDPPGHADPPGNSGNTPKPAGPPMDPPGHK
jgi:hypothetical protein